MPGAAHQVANSAISYGKTKVEETKKAGGYTKWVVETVERPVNYTLDTRVGQSALKVGDYGLTIADRAVDAAMPTVKAADAIVRPRVTAVTTTVSNTSKAVSTTVSKTTTAVVTPVANAYTGVVTVADNVVDRVLPEPEEPKLAPVTAIGVGMKVGRRVRVRVGRAATRTRKAGSYCVERTRSGVNYTVERTKATVSYAVEQAKPSNIKKNVIGAYDFSLKSLDGFVDKYLPDEDGEVAKGPVSLGKKVVKRTYRKSLAAVKYAATAVRNSPTTFKNAYKTISTKATKMIMDTTAAIKARAKALANMKVRVRVITYKDIEPYLLQAQTRSLQTIKATDELLMRYRMTALLRNFAVNRYTLNVAPIVNRIAAPKAAAPAKEEAKAAPAPVSPVKPAEKYELFEDKPAAR